LRRADPSAAVTRRTPILAAMEPGRLTDEGFWDHFWEDVTIPAVVDPGAIFDRNFVPQLDRYLAGRTVASVVEVGCAPGRWLVHCAQRYGASVTGYESSPGGAAKTRENFRHHGIDGTVIEEDFVDAELPDGAHDVVLSLGFIEHFDDPVPLVARHAQLLRPGGLLFLEVPNLRGLQLPVLRWTRSPLLGHHNLDVMSARVLTEAATAAGLRPLDVRYLGGFEPSFIDLAGRSIALRAPYAALARLRHRARWTDRLNGRLVSGYLCGVFERPAR
jgi:SAM-dependent methyltransferase